MGELSWKEPALLSPSLISICDLCNLEHSVGELERAGMSLLHIDILDGYFSPSMPLGLETVRQLRSRTNLAFDVHLMACSQEFFVEELLELGVEQLIFHIEMEPHVDHLLNRIRDAGIRAGVALKPATPLCQLEYVLEKCDTVLLMLINPGFAQNRSEGQIPCASRKIAELRRMIDQMGLDTRIELDGRISRQNIEEYHQQADLFVAGSTCLEKENLEKSARRLQQDRRRILLGSRDGTAKSQGWKKTTEAAEEKREVR